MVRVTSLDYYMEKKLKEKIDLCISRSTGTKKMDNLWIIDGDEGYGKSTFAVHCAKYISEEMGRPFSVKNVFFDLKDMIAFAKSTKEQIIIWDEAALGGLSTEWRNKYQIELTKLLMTARKKKHFWIFNIPKFFKLNEYLIVDRAIALVHVYARNETELGRFIYFKKKSKEFLFYAWRSSKKRLYKKYKDLHGTFPNVLAKIIDEKEYDKAKDKAIESIGTDNSGTSVKVLEINWLKHHIATLDLPLKDIAKKLSVTERTIYKWRKIKREDMKNHEIS